MKVASSAKWHRSAKTGARSRVLFTAAQEDAIRGIRAAFPPRRVMVFSMRPVSDHALVKAAGVEWVVSRDGAIRKVES